MSYSNDLILGFDSAGRPVILPKEKRCRHTLILGPTGVGKTKLIEHLVRQDLLHWHKNKCGLAIFDPHHSAVGNSLAFCAAEGLNALPITPINCDPSYLTCFNPLRARKGVEAAAVVSACTDSLLHSLGQWNRGTETPRLEKWLRVILLSILLSGGTLGDSMVILRSPELRKAMARHVEDDVARSVWASVASMREAEFSEITESLANRMIKFLCTSLLRLSLNQNLSLDFSTILAQGHIVLISLSTAGGAMDEADARTLGGLLLQDLWLAARLRGKGEAGQMRSFRVYLDEFSRFLTPLMAEGIAESRGYGIEWCFACQSTTQMEDTPAAKQVLNAVLANAHTKIAFGAQHAADLEILSAMLYRNEIGDAVKHQHYATRVLAHDIKYLQSTSESVTRGTARSANWSTSESATHASGTTRSHSQSQGVNTSRQRAQGASDTLTVSNSEATGSGKSSAESEAQGTTASRATGTTRQSTASKSESRHIDADYDTLAKIVGPKPEATFREAYVDEDERFRNIKKAIDQATSEGTSEGASESSGVANTHSRSTARAVQTNISHTRGVSRGASTSESEGLTMGDSKSTSDGVSESESRSIGTSETVGGSETESDATTRATSMSPMLMPKLGLEALPPQFRSPEEQLFQCGQRISSQPDRHAVVRIGINPPQEIVTPTVEPARITGRGTQAFARSKLKRLPFALTTTEAALRLEARRQQFEAKFLGPNSTEEPASTVRRIRGASHG